jgi:predicted metalloprotease with PDZ domain
MVRTLSHVVEFDWSAFFVDKLHNTRADAPLDGLDRGGYRLVYRDEPTATWKAKEQLTANTSFIFSLGLSVTSEGQVQEVLWESPAYEAAITPDRSCWA